MTYLYISQALAEEEKVEVMPTFFFIKNGTKVRKKASLKLEMLFVSFSFATFFDVFTISKVHEDTPNMY